MSFGRFERLVDWLFSLAIDSVVMAVLTPAVRDVKQAKEAWLGELSIVEDTALQAMRVTG